MESKSSDLILHCCINVYKSACKIARLVPQYKVTVLSFQLLLKMAEILHEKFSKVLYHLGLFVSHGILSLEANHFILQGGEEMKEKQNQLLSKLNDIQRDFTKWRDGLLRNPLMHTSGFTYPSEIQV